MQGAGKFGIAATFGDDMQGQKNGPRPYLSESGLRHRLESQGYSPAKVRKALDPANGDGLIGGLLQAAMIERHEHGWVVIDDTWASAMLMRRSAK